MLNKLLITLIIFYPVWVQAESSELTVTADKVEIKEQSSTSTYTGNAKATRGETYIKADVIKIIHPNQELKSIRITGTPAFIKYISDNKKTKVEASANIIDYDIKSEILLLQGKVKVTKDKNSISAERIKLNKKTGELLATSTAKSRVTTVFEIK